MKTTPILLFFFIITCLLASCSKTETGDITYLNTPDTLVTKRLMYETNPPQNLISTTEYFYNNLGQLIKTTSKYRDEAHYSYYDTLEYNNSKSYKRTAFYYNKQINDWKKSSTETRTYPNDSTEIISTTSESSEYTHIIKIYRKDNLKIKEETFNNDFLYQTIYYNYSNNKLTTEKCYFHDNTEISYKKNYTYFGNDIIIKTFDKNDKLTDLFIRKYKNGKLQSVFYKSYTWEMGKVILKLEYDKYGRILNEFNDPVQLPIMSSIAMPTTVIYQY